MQQVGGVTHEFGFTKMRWERNRMKMSDNLIPYFEKGTSLKNMGIKSGDQLITKSTCVSVLRNFIEVSLPLITFGTSVVFFYLTYQQQVYMVQNIRR